MSDAMECFWCRTSSPTVDMWCNDEGQEFCEACFAREYPQRYEAEKKSSVVSFEDHLENVLVEINDMMVGRHEKYGPGNIAEFGPLGILVRMSDKFSRLKNGQENHDDETVENTLDDVIGYALIWKLWLRKEWPGSE